MTDTAGTQAWELVELASREPDRAAQRAREVLARLDDDGDRDVDLALVAGARAALGLVLLYGGDPAAAEDHLVIACDAAERAGDLQLLGRAAAARMGVAARTGRPELALRIADETQPRLDGRALANVMINRATVLAVGFGRPRDAIAAYDEVERSISDVPEDLWAILVMNRGTQHMRIGNLVEAHHDLTDAAQTYERLGKSQARVDAAIHLAIVAARRGDFPTLFELYQSLVLDGTLDDNPHHHLDLSECLLAAGLVAEARATCDRAIELTPDVATEVALLVRVLASEIATRSGDPQLAAARALEARAAAAGMGHHSVVARADVLLAVAESGGVAPSEAERIVAALDDVGLGDDALRAALGLATRSLLSGDRATVHRLLASRDDVDREHAPSRARLRHRDALMAAASGDGASARRQLSIGIADLERERATFAAPDLRAAASDRAPAMSRLGLHLAVQAGRPRAVLDWAERVRATSLRLATPTVPIGAGERDELDRMRRTTALDPHQTATIERRLTVGRRIVRSEGSVVRRRSARDICDRLGADHVMFEYIELDGRFMVCVVDNGRASLLDLDLTVADVEHSVGKILFSLRRMATRSGAAAEAASVVVAELGRRLGEQLLPDRHLRGNQVVIVPTGPLHHVPWSSLPQLVDQNVVIAPSAHLWFEADARDRRGRDVLTVVGPGLRAADDEADAVAKVWSSRHEPIQGTAELMRRHLPGKAVAHFCCHGRFRTDSPQFSALDLHDGPFTVFDLEGLERLPPVVILSACSLGSVDVKLGDDLLGFPAALFTRGVATLIAAVLPVEDDASRELMVDVHRNLATGMGAAEALRHARVTASGRDARHAAAAAGFICFGAG